MIRFFAESILVRVLVIALAIPTTGLSLLVFIVFWFLFKNKMKYSIRNNIIQVVDRGAYSFSNVSFDELEAYAQNFGSVTRPNMNDGYFEFDVNYENDSYHVAVNLEPRTGDSIMKVKSV
jgi:hypothetical protein